MQADEREWDAIVVGSGITGGWAAKELTERGLRVLLVERGRSLEGGSSYGDDDVPRFGNLGAFGEKSAFQAEYPIQSKAPSFTEATRPFFVRDLEHPYAQGDDTDWAWIRGYQLGGRSLTWGYQVYRWSDLDFEANLRDGHGCDWPIRYADIEPWYDHVEEFIGVSGQPEGLPQIPDGRFLPPMPLTRAEHFCKQQIERGFPERRVTIGRVAILTREHRGRPACVWAERGAGTWASYFSSLSSTLPAARATGRLEVLTESIAERVNYDSTSGRASGVRVVDASTKERRDLRARLVFLCASTIPTTQILLNSRCEAFPNGLANRSGTLGRFLMDHTIGLAAIGILDGFEDEPPPDGRPNGIYVPRFRNLADAEPGFVRGYGYQGLGFRSGDATLMALAAFGECLPRETNRIELSARRDAWGLPLPEIHFRWSDNEIAMRRDATEQGVAMLEAIEAKRIFAREEFGVGGEAIHEMGTARMGRDPRSSVLGAYNQAHDVPNLFVTDGACMTSSACQNPSITYMALTARAAAFAANELGRGAL